MVSICRIKVKGSLGGESMLGEFWREREVKDDCSEFCGKVEKREHSFRVSLLGLEIRR